MVGLTIIDGTVNSALYQENPEGECPAISLCPQAQAQAQAHLGYAAGQ